MPLINCPDCNKEVSPAAPVCINCGRPIAVNIAQNYASANQSRQFIPLQATPKNNYGIGFVVCLALIVVGAFLRVASDYGSFGYGTGIVLAGAGGVYLLILILRVCFTLLQKV